VRFVRSSLSGVTRPDKDKPSIGDLSSGTGPGRRRPDERAENKKQGRTMKRLDRLRRVAGSDASLTKKAGRVGFYVLGRVAVRANATKLLKRVAPQVHAWLRWRYAHYHASYVGRADPSWSFPLFEQFSAFPRRTTDLSMPERRMMSRLQLDF